MAIIWMIYVCIKYVSSLYQVRFSRILADFGEIFAHIFVDMHKNCGFLGTFLMPC